MIILNNKRLLTVFFLSSIITACATTVTTSHNTHSAHQPSSEITIPSLKLLEPYHGPHQRILVFPWNISKIDLDKYPELRQKHVGFGISNRLLDAIYESDRFELIEEKQSIIKRMMQNINQCTDAECNPASSAIKLKTADFIVYPEVYHFGVEKNTDIAGISGKHRQSTEIGIQINFVNTRTGVTESLGSYIGRFTKESVANILSSDLKLPFSQSALGHAADQAITGALIKAINRLQKRPVMIQAEKEEPVEYSNFNKTSGSENIEPINETFIIKNKRFFALIIGNNAYKALPKLETAVYDAQVINKILKNKYGYETKLLLNGTRQTIIEQLDELRQTLTEEDNLLIYYAGHGYYDKSAKRGYWLPVDAMQTSTAQWVSNADITDKIKAIKAKHIILVADSCFSGTLTRGLKRMKFEKEAIQSTFYNRMYQKKSRTVLSSGGVEPVMDSGGGKHSVFAKAFIDILTENSSIIDGTGFFNKIRKKVVVNAEQTPEYSNIRFSGHDGGDYLFIQK